MKSLHLRIVTKPAPDSDSSVAAELQFLHAELLTGLTLSGIALEAKRKHKIDRNRINARKAYDSVLRFMPSTIMLDSECEEVKLKLAKLKAELLLLGEDV